MSQLATPTTILTKIPLNGYDPKGNYLELVDLPSLTIDVNLEIKQLFSIQQVSANCAKYKFDHNQGKLLIESSIITNDNFIIEIKMQDKVQNQIVKCGNMAALTIIPEFTPKTNSFENKEFNIFNRLLGIDDWRFNIKSKRIHKSFFIKASIQFNV